MSELIGQILGEWLYDFNNSLRREFFAHRVAREEVIRARMRKAWHIRRSCEEGSQ